VQLGLLKWAIRKKMMLWKIGKWEEQRFPLWASGASAAFLAVGRWLSAGARAPLRSFMRRCCCYGRSAAVSRQSVCSFAPRQTQQRDRRRHIAVCALRVYFQNALCSHHLPADLGRPRPAPVQCPVIVADNFRSALWHLQPCARVRNWPKVIRESAMANHHHLRPSAIQLLRGGPCRVEGWLNVCGEYTTSKVF
jgi:hypothetical protein